MDLFAGRSASCYQASFCSSQDTNITFSAACNIQQMQIISVYGLVTGCLEGTAVGCADGTGPTETRKHKNSDQTVTIQERNDSNNNDVMNDLRG